MDASWEPPVGFEPTSTPLQPTASEAALVRGQEAGRVTGPSQRSRLSRSFLGLALQGCPAAYDTCSRPDLWNVEPAMEALTGVEPA